MIDFKTMANLRTVKTCWNCENCIDGKCIKDPKHPNRNCDNVCDLWTARHINETDGEKIEENAK